MEVVREGLGRRTGGAATRQGHYGRGDSRRCYSARVLEIWVWDACGYGVDGGAVPEFRPESEYWAWEDIALRPERHIRARGDERSFEGCARHYFTVTRVCVPA